MEDNSFKVMVLGRPNVGKSSLFNALLGYRRSIVVDHPGTTLDAITEEVVWEKKKLSLWDSQGIFGEEDIDVLNRLLKQADLCLFVVDIRDGVTPFDKWLAHQIRMAEKPTLLLVNKTEGRHELDQWDFLELGFDEVLSVSATHRRGLSEVRHWCAAQCELSDKAKKIEDRTLANLTVSFLGRPNVGKSTLMNRICGEGVSRVSPQALTTRDFVSFEFQSPKGKVRLLDTAGIRRRGTRDHLIEKFSVQAAKRAIRSSDVVFLLLDAREPFTEQDKRLLDLLSEEGKATVILLNFWDLLKASQKVALRKSVKDSILFSEVEILPLSALTGYNVNKWLPLAHRLHEKSAERVGTGQLNSMLKEIVSKNPPPARGRGRFNILYVSQVKTKPPTFVFFLNRKESLPQSYKNYLQNEFRRSLGFKSQPLKLLFRPA